ncbi:MAG: dienelactone hydrolase family protein [Actinomycetota bacterium]|nr:dienelactone hydrolase family protein [Actinomycetota bacterium]
MSGLWAWPPGARACVVVAHGAGGDMTSPLLVGFTTCLNEAGFGTLRFNFPYSEQGRKAPDRAPVLVATSRAAHDLAVARAGKKHVFVGGKSMGGRIASMAVAEGMPADGLIFLGYPLHPPGRPDRLRDEHLYRIRVPMLFIEGTEDPFARFDLLKELTSKLGRWAVLHPVEGGDHSFRVRANRLPDHEIGRLVGSVVARFMQSAQV